MRRPAISFVIVALAMAGASCTVVRQTQQVHETEGRIDVKTGQLTRAQAEQAALQAQTSQIQADLDKKKLSMTELESRLAALQRSNDRAATDTDVQVRRKKALDAALSRTRADLKSLQQNSTIDLAEKQSRYEALKVKARQEIEVASQIQ